MSANAQLLDAAISHEVDLRKFSNGVLYRVMAELNRADARLVAALAEALLRLDAQSFTVERLESLLSSVRALNSAAYDAVRVALEAELRGLAEVEAAAQAAQLRAAIPSVVQLRFPIAAVSADQVYAAALSQPFQGRLLREWASSLAESRLRQIREAVRQGYVDGQTTSEIVRRIRGTRALKYADGLLERPRREVATIVQTALSHTAQLARQASYDANADLLKGVKWTATLDGKTSPPCMLRDGKLYTADRAHKPIGHSIKWGAGPGRLHFNAITAGSLVCTDRGLVPIESVCVGDRVLTHRGRFKPVTDARSKVNETGFVRVLRMESGRILRATDDHPIFVAGKGWVFVGAVEIGDAVFRDAKQAAEVSRAGGVVVPNAEDRPSVPDERGVALARTIKLAAACVDLKCDLHGGPSEIEDVVIGAVLENPAIIECESTLHYLFALAHVLAEHGNHAFRELLARLVAHDVSAHALGSTNIRATAATGRKDSVHDAGHRGRIAARHPLGMPGVDGAVFLREAGSPMVGATLGLTATRGEIDASLRGLGANRNADDLRVAGEGAVGESALSFDCPKGAPFADVLFKDEFTVVGQRFCHDRVVAIELSEYRETVHDLAVEGDASYVCNSIVVSNCRSVSVPVTKSWKELGIDADEMPAGQRASMDGAVPADTTYAEWIKRQPAARQDEILGPERAKLLRSGKVTFERFYDNGRWLTLEQLRKRVGP